MKYTKSDFIQAYNTEKQANRLVILSLVLLTIIAILAARMAYLVNN